MEVRAVNKISPKSNFVIPAFDVKGLMINPLLKSLGGGDRKYIEDSLGDTELANTDNKFFNLPSDPKRVVVVVGLGVKKDWSQRKFILASRRVVSSMKTNKIESAIVSLDEFSPPNMEASKMVSLAVQNFLMADYSFVKYKEEPKEGWPKIKKIELYSISAKKLEKPISEGRIIGNSINACRNLSNTPGGLMTPKMLASAAEKMAKQTGVKIKILGETEMAKLSMGGVLGVASGSDEKPQFIIMEYGPEKKKPIVFVGKGITFDTGGLNIKPGKSMLEMHMDMSGGAAVIHAIEIIARLKLPVHVIGLVPAVENMPSGSSYRPGDLLKTITGKTIEVLDTDAEGRVVLSDALGYAQKYKPALIVDVATLTGAAVVALGQRISAIFSNQDRLLTLGKSIGEATGDYVWPMPLWDDYAEDIKGTFGDVANTGNTRYGGAITAAAFLKQFVGDYPWIHLDIAPTTTSIDGQYLEKGAAGAGVRFLVEIARNFK